MEKLISILNELNPENVIAVQWYEGKWKVHLSAHKFNALYSTRSVIWFDKKSDKHFVEVGNVLVYCLVDRIDPEPEVREVTI